MFWIVKEGYFLQQIHCLHESTPHLPKGPMALQIYGQMKTSISALHSELETDVAQFFISFIHGCTVFHIWKPDVDTTSPVKGQEGIEPRRTYSCFPGKLLGFGRLCLQCLHILPIRTSNIMKTRESVSKRDVRYLKNLERLEMIIDFEPIWEGSAR